ncbi:MAG: hypothetical protein RL230_2914 [Pseudomonadota bacterium]
MNDVLQGVEVTGSLLSDNQQTANFVAAFENFPLELYGNLPYDAIKRIWPCLPPALPLVSKPESAPIFI